MDPAAIPPDAVPRLPRGVRLRHDEARGQWTLLAPERVLQLDPIAAEILKRCTGQASFSAIVDELAKAFSADRARIDADVRAMLAGLHAKKVLDL
jgi:pyrroloquinoline quinone biosynthesis protein D